MAFMAARSPWTGRLIPAIQALTDFHIINMVICMKTTLNLDDTLMRTVKEQAARTGNTVTSLVESALRELVHRERKPVRGYQFRWKTVGGAMRPGVDLVDRDQLLSELEK
jgi:hypothetical protein